MSQAQMVCTEQHRLSQNAVRSICNLQPPSQGLQQVGDAVPVGIHQQHWFHVCTSVSRPGSASLTFRAESSSRAAQGTQRADLLWGQD